VDGFDTSTLAESLCLSEHRRPLNYDDAAPHQLPKPRITPLPPSVTTPPPSLRLPKAMSTDWLLLADVGGKSKSMWSCPPSHRDGVLLSR
jgi:hypothetical protein